MPANKPSRPKTRARHRPYIAGTEDASRAISQLAESVQRTEAKVGDRSTSIVDLSVGANSVAHRLGRRPIGASITPTVADASFAWAMGETSTTVVVITVVGVAQLGATLEVW